VGRQGATSTLQALRVVRRTEFGDSRNETAIRTEGLIHLRAKHAPVMLCERKELV